MPDAGVSIGIAVVERAGKYLVGRRTADADLPNLDEFPGGKCKANESPCDCAARECLEETGVQVEPVELLLALPFEYPHAKVQLFFWKCRPVDALAIRKLPDGCRWIPADALPALNFPEANSPLLELLASRRAKG